MGKIFSPPKMPSIPAPVIYTAPTPEPAATSTTPTTSNDPPASSGGGEQDTAPEVTPDEQRVQNILTRRRGRLGTIATSFNGALNDITSVSPARKTLLGE